ncbi:unnamed protein product [Schistosoma margrebowiei]|uniref:Uncharacterized protein n=1 Tax=Schistosoma margrebowiei TaxID=48269 RepID=A0A183MWD9_9TREM|nr:unnamed protein product [Schistosoma margrebowiei]
MVVVVSQQETLDPGFVLLVTRQHGVPVILRELVLTDGFNPVSPSFTVRDVQGPGFPVNYLQSLSNLNIMHAVLSHLNWWPHCNLVNGIRSALNKDLTHMKLITGALINQL